MNFDHIGSSAFSFIIGIVFFVFLASFFYLIKKICRHSREVRQNKNVLTTTLAVEEGETIVFQPGEYVLTVKQPMMASLYKIPGGPHNHPTVSRVVHR